MTIGDSVDEPLERPCIFKALAMYDPRGPVARRAPLGLATPLGLAALGFGTAPDAPSRSGWVRARPVARADRGTASAASSSSSSAAVSSSGVPVRRARGGLPARARGGEAGCGVPTAASARSRERRRSGLGATKLPLPPFTARRMSWSFSALRMVSLLGKCLCVQTRKFASGSSHAGSEAAVPT